jgi:hypothetical protein
MMTEKMIEVFYAKDASMLGFARAIERATLTELDALTGPTGDKELDAWLARADNVALVRLPSTSDEGMVFLAKAYRQERARRMELEKCGPSNCPQHPRNTDCWVRESALLAEKKDHDAARAELQTIKEYCDARTKSDGEIIARLEAKLEASKASFEEQQKGAIGYAKRNARLSSELEQARKALESLGNLLGGPTMDYSPENAIKEYRQRIQQAHSIIAVALSTKQQDGATSLCGCGHKASHHLSRGCWANGCTCPIIGQQDGDR